MDHNAKSLKDYLAQNKNTILTKWFHLLLEAYPAETARFLKKENSQFANPVGHNIYQGIESIYDELLHDMDEDKLLVALDKIVRIKAVQDVSPSQAIVFIFVLKKIVREELKIEIKENKISSQELFDYESKLDELALQAFKIYTECREKIYQLRINELKKKYEILERINLSNGIDPSTFMQCSNFKCSDE